MPLDSKQDEEDDDDPLEGLPGLGDDDDPHSPESVAAFFKSVGVSLDDDEEEKSEEAPAAEPEPETPEAEAKPEEEKSAPAAPQGNEVPRVEGQLTRDEAGRLVDASGTVHDELGMPLITQEEWDEYLADPSVEPGKAQREYLDFQVERNRRQMEQRMHFAEARRQEEAKLPALCEDWFEDAKGAAALLHEEAGKVIETIAPELRLTPGYYENAVRLLFAADPAKYLDQFGVSPKGGRAKGGQGPPAPEAVPAATTGSNIRLARNGARTGAEMAATPPPASSNGAKDYGLTREEKAAAKKFDMTEEEYAKYKK